MRRLLRRPMHNELRSSKTTKKGRVMIAKLFPLYVILMGLGCWLVMLVGETI